MFRKAIALIPLVIICAAASAEPQFVISPLGYRTDSTDTVPGLINNSGVIVGNAIVGIPSGQMPFFLSSGAPVPFSTAPGNSVFSPETINNAGEIAGFLMADAQNPEPPFYSAAIYENGQYIQLQAPDANVFSDYQVSGINNNGNSVGYIVENTGLSRAVEWINGQPLFLDANANEVNSANAINDQGWVAGGTGPSSGAYSDPVIWHDGVTTYIPLPADATSGTAVAINNAGQVLVAYTGANIDNDLLLWDKGIVTLLPQFSDSIFGTYAISMNDSGSVVGTSANRAVYWQDGQIYDLNDVIAPDSGWVLIEANSINDAGDIVGLGQYDGIDMPFLLTPDGNVSVPEPVAISLAAGFCLLAACRRIKASS